MIPYLSSVVIIFLHLFCYPNCLAFLTHLCCCCLVCLVSPPSYPLTSLTAVPVILSFCFHCTYQPDLSLNFPSNVVSIILNLCLLYYCYSISLRHLYCCCLHLPASLTLPSTLLRVSVTPLPPCISTHCCKVSN